MGTSQEMRGKSTDAAVARSYQEVEDLRVAVRKGRLFDVQEWGAVGPENAYVQARKDLWV